MLSEGRKKSLGAAAERFHASLDEPTWAYLRRRGLDEEMVNGYRLGVVSSDVSPTFQPYVGRLSIPFITPTGVVAIRYRCLADHDCKEYELSLGPNGFHKKYLQGKGEGDRLYNVRAFREMHPAIAVAEGEIDAMVIDTHVMPAVGVTGKSKWKPHWTRCLDGYDKVFIVGDGDKAGREFVDRLMELLPNGQAVVLPDGMDANEVFLAEGPERLTEIVLGDVEDGEDAT